MFPWFILLCVDLVITTYAFTTLGIGQSREIASPDQNGETGHRTVSGMQESMQCTKLTLTEKNEGYGPNSPTIDLFLDFTVLFFKETLSV